MGDLWSYLNTYLAQPLVGTPGVTYSYNNENFTILQGVIDQVTGQDYVTWVTENVLVPAGIDPSIFNPNPDPSTTATLLYSAPSDTREGYYYGPLNFVAPGGFISTTLELLKILLALRNTSVLPAAAISEMLNDEIGWFPSRRQLRNVLPKRWRPSQRRDAAADSEHVHRPARRRVRYRAGGQHPAAPRRREHLRGRFDSRGLLVTDLPPGIAAVISAATYLPKVAPAAYCSIMGAGFTDQAATDWSSSITGSTLPASVGGISVSVNGKPAYVEYISATQINFLLPSSAAIGIAEVELTTPTGVMVYAGDRRRGSRPFLLYVERRALPVVGLRHRERRRVCGRGRRVAGIS